MSTLSKLWSTQALFIVREGYWKCALAELNVCARDEGGWTTAPYHPIILCGGGGMPETSVSEFRQEISSQSFIMVPHNTC